MTGGGLVECEMPSPAAEGPAADESLSVAALQALPTQRTSLTVSEWSADMPMAPMARGDAAPPESIGERPVEASEGPALLTVPPIDVTSTTESAARAVGWVDGSASPPTSPSARSKRPRKLSCVSSGAVSMASSQAVSPTEQRHYWAWVGDLYDSRRRRSSVFSRGTASPRSTRSGLRGSQRSPKVIDQTFRAEGEDGPGFDDLMQDSTRQQLTLFTRRASTGHKALPSRVQRSPRSALKSPRAGRPFDWSARSGAAYEAFAEDAAGHGEGECRGATPQGEAGATAPAGLGHAEAAGAAPPALDEAARERAVGQQELLRGLDGALFEALTADEQTAVLKALKASVRHVQDPNALPQLCSEVARGAAMVQARMQIVEGKNVQGALCEISNAKGFDLLPEAEQATVQQAVGIDLEALAASPLLPQEVGVIHRAAARLAQLNVGGVGGAAMVPTQAQILEAKDVQDTLRDISTSKGFDTLPADDRAAVQQAVIIDLDALAASPLLPHQVGIIHRTAARLAQVNFELSHPMPPPQESAEPQQNVGVAAPAPAAQIREAKGVQDALRDISTSKGFDLLPEDQQAAVQQAIGVDLDALVDSPQLPQEVGVIHRTAARLAQVNMELSQTMRPPPPEPLEAHSAFICTPREDSEPRLHASLAAHSASICIPLGQKEADASPLQPGVGDAEGGAAGSTPWPPHPAASKGPAAPTLTSGGSLRVGTKTPPPANAPAKLPAKPLPTPPLRPTAAALPAAPAPALTPLPHSQPPAPQLGIKHAAQGDQGLAAVPAVPSNGGPEAAAEGVWAGEEEAADPVRYAMAVCLAGLFGITARPVLELATPAAFTRHSGAWSPGGGAAVAVAVAWLGALMLLVGLAAGSAMSANERRGIFGVVHSMVAAGAVWLVVHRARSAGASTSTAPDAAPQPARVAGILADAAALLLLCWLLAPDGDAGYWCHWFARHVLLHVSPVWVGQAAFALLAVAVLTAVNVRGVYRLLTRPVDGAPVLVRWRRAFPPADHPVQQVFVVVWLARCGVVHALYCTADAAHGRLALDASVQCWAGGHAAYVFFAVYLTACVLYTPTRSPLPHALGLAVYLAAVLVVRLALVPADTDDRTAAAITLPFIAAAAASASHSLPSSSACSRGERVLRTAWLVVVLLCVLCYIPVAFAGTTVPTTVLTALLLAGGAAGTAWWLCTAHGGEEGRAPPGGAAGADVEGGGDAVAPSEPVAAIATAPAVAQPARAAASSRRMNAASVGAVPPPRGTAKAAELAPLHAPPSRPVPEAVACAETMGSRRRQMEMHKPPCDAPPDSSRPQQRPTPTRGRPRSQRPTSSAQPGRSTSPVSGQRLSAPEEGPQPLPDRSSSRVGRPAPRQGSSSSPRPQPGLRPSHSSSPGGRPQAAQPGLPSPPGPRTQLHERHGAETPQSRAAPAVPTQMVRARPRLPQPGQMPVPTRLPPSKRKQR